MQATLPIELTFLQNELQGLDHRIARLSSYRFVTYGASAIAFVSEVAFYMLALFNTLPGPLRHVTTHLAGTPSQLNSIGDGLTAIVLVISTWTAVAQRSPTAFFFGLAVSFSLYFGFPNTMEMMAISKTTANCELNAPANVSCVIPSLNRLPYPAEYVQAQRIAFAICHHKPVTAVQRAELDRDLTWISAHFPSISGHQFYQLDVAAYGHPTFPRVQTYAQSIISAKAAHKTAYEVSLEAAGTLFGMGLLLEALLLKMNRNRKRFIQKVCAIYPINPQ
jgi:hypothetical protein